MRWHTDKQTNKHTRILYKVLVIIIAELPINEWQVLNIFLTAFLCFGYNLPIKASEERMHVVVLFPIYVG